MEFQLKFLRQGINLNLGQDVTHSQDRPGCRLPAPGRGSSGSLQGSGTAPPTPRGEQLFDILYFPRHPKSLGKEISQCGDVLTARLEELELSLRLG